VLKVMSLFSGLQVVNIICSIVKMKLVALWLHSTGVALFGIFQSAQETIATFTDLGLRQSAVKEIAGQSAGTRVHLRLVQVVRRWSVLAGLLGASVMLVASPALSQWFFRTPAHFWPFAAIGVAMFLNCLLYGEQALLQATSGLKSLAKGTLWGTIAGLVLSIPAFRYLSAQTSVIISIIAYSLAILLFTLHYRYKPPRPADNLRPAPLGFKELWHEGRPFVRLGVYLSVATFITTLSHLAFVAVLTRVSSVETTGYFQAGDTLVTRYMGLIFSALAMEYFPRISAAARHNHRLAVYVNHEITLLLIIITPVVILFMLLRTHIIALLYSSEFQIIESFVTLAVMSTLLKAVSWCISYCIIAKGDGRAYILCEGIDAVVSLVLLTAGYYYGSLAGVGVAYIVWYLVYTLICYLVAHRRYRLAITSTTRTAIAVSVIVVAAAYAAICLLPVWLGYLLLVPAALLFVVPLRRLLAR
jgi:PST family polysaccharide transporter